MKRVVDGDEGGAERAARVVEAPVVVTECCNELTKNVDVANEVGIVRQLRQADMQIFTGWRNYECINDAAFLKKLSLVVDTLSPYFSRTSTKKLKVIFSGAGTSGRLSFFCAREMNNLAQKNGLKSVSFDYLIAGGDLALIKGIEKCEDDVVAAVQDFSNLLNDKEIDHYVYIGITCGLSAPYIGGQVDYILNNENLQHKITTMVMGFNEVDASRKKPIENWDKNLNGILKQMEQKMISNYSSGLFNFFFLNPICGPEPITGSTRMKSGTTTKILLDSIFGLLFSKSLSEAPVPLTAKRGYNPFIAVFINYEITNRYSYCHEESISKVMRIVTTSLSHKRHTYYIGDDNLGILGLIDASECPPTFGAKLTDIKGLLFNGWKTMNNKSGDLSANGSFFKITEHDYAPFEAEDVVVVLHAEGQPVLNKINLLETIKQAPKQPRIVVIDWTIAKGPAGDPFITKLRSLADFHFTVELPFFDILPGLPTFLELSVKWTLNCISTGAHVLIGKVYGNVMIDLQISNNKLFWRGVSMLATLGSLPEQQAHLNLLRSIYLKDEVGEEIIGLPVSKHIEAAQKREKVIPLAVLLGTNKFKTIQEANQQLSTDPVVSRIINKLTH